MSSAVARPINHIGVPTQTFGLRLAEASRSDYALARSVARGGMPALGDLYERHNRRVYAVCLNMTHNSAEAEDLTQEVFLHLVRKVGSFRGESQFSTWLHRLTVNLVLMHFRRKAARRDQTPESLESVGKVIHQDWKPFGAQLADRIALDSALAKLPAGCRSVFVLFDLIGYKHQEIANLLGVSVGTSKSQLHKARFRIRRLMRNVR
jgi:RNA polymerase sigma-70 factor (ECF subfamily)